MFFPRSSVWTVSFLILLANDESVSRAQEDDTLFFDCAIETYYDGFVDEQQQLILFDQGQLSLLVRETHRNVLPYTSSSQEDVWDALIDLDSDGEMIHLIYRDVTVPAMPYGTAETWNREHLWPKSRGVGTSGPDYTDVHHLRPSDYSNNAARNNRFFGDCEDVCTSRPANDEAASDTALDGAMFLPPASVRGDIARAILYMKLRYAWTDEANTNVLELTDCPDDNLSNQMAYLSDLLQWHAEDPPDDPERLRNERVCSRWQGNRNVFVDFPELAFRLHGDPAEKPYNCGGEAQTPTTTTLAPTTTTAPAASPIGAALTCDDFSPGDVQVVSLSSDNPDSVVLVALDDLPRGLQLFLTDNAWTGSDFLSNEGTLELILSADLPKGTIFGYGDDSGFYGASWESVGSGSFALSTAGDSILLYCMANDGSIHHLGGLIVGTWTDDDSDTSAELDTSASRKPESLSTFGAIEVDPGWDNLVYTGTTEGTKMELLTALADSDNWEGSNTERFVYSVGAFVVHEDTKSNIAINNLSPDDGEVLDEISAGNIWISNQYVMTTMWFMAVVML